MAINGDAVMISDIGSGADWSQALQGIEAVIHLAARAHRLVDTVADPRADYFAVNAEGTRRLAEQASGRIRRFVFISTVGVHGSTSKEGAIHERSPMSPETPYAESKARAEDYVRSFSGKGAFETVVLRPPLVYGAGAPGNLERLVAAVRRGAPLPFGSVRNRRSLIDVKHLVNAIVKSIDSTPAKNQTYVVADSEVVSTPEIIRAIAAGLGKSAHLLSVPPVLLKSIGLLTRRQRMLEQLTGNLEIDASAFVADFGSIQPTPTLAGLERAARETIATVPAP